MPKISTIKIFRLFYVRFIHFLAAFFANLALFLHHDFFLSKNGTLVASSSTEAADVMWRGIGPDLVLAQKAILERTKPTCLILIIYENNNWGWKNVVWIINDCLSGGCRVADNRRWCWKLNPGRVGMFFSRFFVQRTYRSRIWVFADKNKENDVTSPRLQLIQFSQNRF